MANIILCEGETDKILIGYYMEKVCGWNYTKKERHFISEPISWFCRDKQELGIWSCGGCDFSQQLDKISMFVKDGGTIEKLLIIADNDDCASEHKVKNFLLQSDIWDNNAQNNTIAGNWYNVVVQGFGFGAMDVAYILLPQGEYGALETFMLRSIENSSEDKKEVVVQVKKFLTEFKSDIYLKRRREKVKAELGISLSIFSPDKVFNTMNEIIKSIEWEKYLLVNDTFKILRDM